MSTKDLSGITIVIQLSLNEIAKHCWKAGHRFTWDHKKAVDRESRLISRKIKEIIHCLNNPNHINKVSTILLEIWLPNL